MATVSADNVGSGPSGALFGNWDQNHDTAQGPTGFFAGLFNNSNPTGTMRTGPAACRAPP